MSVDTPDPQLGRRIGGRYVLVKSLGSGGAGKVYEALQEDLGRHVALKLLRPELESEPEVLARFRREARAAAALGHPHIAQVLDFAEPKGREPAYIAFELVKGASLHAVLEETPTLSVEHATQLTLQILAGLEAAHQAGIVHRDLKPANVFVADVAGVGEVAKILDFGIAQVHEGAVFRRLTSTGVIVGTPRYMSPEQISGRTVDARSDLWSVGVLLYRMLSGHPPFDGRPGEVLQAIRTQPVPPFPPELRVPPALQQVILGALEKDPGGRWPSAHAMSDALKRAARGEPVEGSTRDPAAPGETQRARRPRIADPPAASSVDARPTMPDPETPRQTQPGHHELPSSLLPSSLGVSSLDVPLPPAREVVHAASANRDARAVEPAPPDVDRTLSPSLRLPMQRTAWVSAAVVSVGALGLAAWLFSTRTTEPEAASPSPTTTPREILPPLPTPVPSEPVADVPLRGTLAAYLRRAEALAQASSSEPLALARVYAVGVDRESGVLDFTSDPSSGTREITELEVDVATPTGTCFRYRFATGTEETVEPLASCSAMRPPLPDLFDLVAAGGRACRGFRGTSERLRLTFRAPVGEAEEGTQVDLADVGGNHGFTATLDAWAAAQGVRCHDAGRSSERPSGGPSGTSPGARSGDGVINPWGD